MDRRSVLAGLTALFADAAGSRRLWAGDSADWTAVLKPYRIAGSLYYVGSRDLASFLLTSPDGHILINSNLTSSVAQIRTSVEKLGFRFHDIRILLISHAHFDHCAGSAELIRLTGAKYMVMDADVSDVESGGRTNFQFGRQKAMLYPPSKVDRVLHNGDQVRLGRHVLTAHQTPGHTRGCTTWSFPIEDPKIQNGKSLEAVIVGGPYALPSYDLVHSAKYPAMAADFERTFRVLESLPCQIFLGAHGSYYNMLAKDARLEAGEASAFIDPEGYKEFVAQAKADFARQFAKQKNGR